VTIRQMNGLIDAVTEVVRLSDQPGLEDGEWENAFMAMEAALAGLAEGVVSTSGGAVLIDLDGIEMRWASEWNESDDGQKRAWRDDMAALITEVHRLRRVSNGYFHEMVRRGESAPDTPEAPE
jgi:hypothetical protein